MVYKCTVRRITRAARARGTDLLQIEQTPTRVVKLNWGSGPQTQKLQLQGKLPRSLFFAAQRDVSYAIQQVHFAPGRYVKTSTTLVTKLLLASRLQSACLYNRPYICKHDFFMQLAVFRDLSPKRVFEKMLNTKGLKAGCVRSLTVLLFRIWKEIMLDTQVRWVQRGKLFQRKTIYRTSLPNLLWKENYHKYYFVALTETWNGWSQISN